MATQLETYQNQVAELYIVFFGRAPDAEGMNHWVQALSMGESVNEVARSFAASIEYQSTYGGRSPTQAIEMFYQNALERPADQAGLTYWLDKLKQGHTFDEIALGKVETAFAGGDKVHPEDTAVVRHKVEISKYVSVTLASDEPAVVDSAFTGITADPASVTTAKARLQAQAQALQGRLISGDEQAQILTGGPGPDSISAGGGDDTIIGGAGADSLRGGPGHDLFVYEAGATGEKLSTADTILDFEPGIDKIKTGIPGLSFLDVDIEDGPYIESYEDFLDRITAVFQTDYLVYVASDPSANQVWVAIKSGGNRLIDEGETLIEGDSLIILQGFDWTAPLNTTDFIA